MKSMRIVDHEGSQPSVIGVDTCVPTGSLVLVATFITGAIIMTVACTYWKDVFQRRGGHVQLLTVDEAPRPRTN